MSIPIYEHPGNSYYSVGRWHTTVVRVFAPSHNESKFVVRVTDDGNTDTIIETFPTREEAIAYARIAPILH